MPHCHACTSERYAIVLDKGQVPIWANVEDDLRPKVSYACRLNRCLQCGHIYQPVDKKLSDMMNELYKSTHSISSTAMGEGNWGKARGLAQVGILEELVDIPSQRSILEIGCDNGYLLKAIQEQGGKDLYGIEPSLNVTSKVGGITFIKGFANDQLKIGKKFDFIFSTAVLEHIENLDGFIQFCRDHSHAQGKVYFAVPNSAKFVSEADPQLFNHAHFQHFTENSAKVLLTRHGYDVTRTFVKGDILGVLAIYSGNCHELHEPTAAIGEDYALRLERLLKKVDRFLREDNIVVHAANNALNNVLGWLSEDYDFTLVDNDNTKHGKFFFGKQVMSLDNVLLTEKHSVLIASNSFHREIKADYLKRGFKGRILDFVNITTR